MIIDAQVHAYERNHPGRPWVGSVHGPEEVNGSQMVQAMNAVGVDGALLVSPWSVYRDDTSFAEEVFLAYPSRFRLIAPIDPNAGNAAEQVSAWAMKPGAVGIRLLMVWGKTVLGVADPGVAAAARAAERVGMPVCVHCWGHLPLMAELAHTYPSTRFVLDHLGLQQPLTPPAAAGSFDALPLVLELANYENVALKVTGVCTMSRQPFPFDDLWAPVGRLIDAFGVERCMWGTDWTRALAVVSYADAVLAFHDQWPISSGERDALMGGTAMQVFKWSKF